MKTILSLPHHNEKGIATIESVLLLSIFVVFMTYCIGMFGVVHTGIMNSISARAYAFETFRNRSNVNYFRDEVGADPGATLKFGIRVHGITTENNGDSPEWNVTTRPLAKGRDVSSVRSAGNADNLFNKTRETGEASPVFIKAVYGLCLNSTCAPSGGG